MNEVTAGSSPLVLWRHVPVLPDDPIVADRGRATLLRARYLDTLDTEDPTPVWIDLNRISVLTPSAADALIVQWLERVRSPRNPVVIAISTWVDDIAHTLDSQLKAAHQSAYRVRSAPFSEPLEPMGDVTPAQRDTVLRLPDLERRLQSAPTARAVADELHLAQSAATNRLSELADKGLVLKAETGGVYTYFHPATSLRRQLADAIGARASLPGNGRRAYSERSTSGRAGTSSRR
ncbi:MAG: hypothetical protein ACR2NO_03950 [Chloroflexota bacterium]